ncbi:hypothetical protein P5V15_012534 [Pogonomyrmex californicus]
MNFEVNRDTDEKLESHRNWAWKHFERISDNQIKCKKCMKTYKSHYIKPEMKAHLYYLHKESYPEEDEKWRTMKIDPNSAWRYYTKDETFKAKCNVCNKQISYAYSLRYLESHLIHNHQTIIKNIQEEIKSSWLFKYFTFVDDPKKIKCSRCDIKLSIFLEKEGLEQHMLLHNINQYSETNRSTEQTNTPTVIQEVPENDAGFEVNRDTDKKLESHRNWAWKHFERTSYKQIKCKKCMKTYKTFGITTDMKSHLYYHHKESNPEEDKKWRTMKVDPNSAWRYYTKDETFRAKCNICEKIIKTGYMLKILESHIINYHETIIKNIQENIKSSWLFKYLTFVDKQNKIKCSHCDDKLSIFLGTEGLKLHMLYHNISQPSETNRSTEQTNTPTVIQEVPENNADFEVNDTDEKLESHRNWAWKHFERISYKQIKCKKCMKTYKTFGITTDMKSHLYYHHKESNPEEDEKWRTMKVDPNSAWRYYTKDETFKAKCNVCNKQISYAYFLSYLESHLIRCHQTIIKNIQEEIKSSWLFKYLTFIDEQKKVKCSRCDNKLSIFLGTEGLEQHMLLHNINQHSETNPSTEQTNRPTVIQKVPENDAGFEVNRDTDEKLESHRNWAWKHFEKISDTIKCKKCTTTYKSHYIKPQMKAHLYYHHKESNPAEDEKWKTMKVDPNSAWRYYTKDKTFRAKCNVCDKQIKCAYALIHLENHLHRHETIIKNIQEEIKSSWLFKYFTFVDEQKKVKCSRCDNKLSIFLGTEGLEQHMLLHNINQSSETSRSTEQTNTPTVIQEVPENDAGKFRMVHYTFANYKNVKTN